MSSECIIHDMEVYKDIAEVEFSLQRSNGCHVKRWHYSRISLYCIVMYAS